MGERRREQNCWYDLGVWMLEEDMELREEREEREEDTDTGAGLTTPVDAKPLLAPVC